MITMLLLFFFIYIIVWRSEAGGLNEIQQVGEDVFYYNMNLNISMRNVAVSVILLSTLGAVLDMALTVTTSVYEVKSHKEDMTFKELIHSGMADRKRSDRNNGEYTSVCIFRRITSAFFLSADAGIFV